MRGVIWMLVGGGCFAPQPPTGAPCAGSACPGALVCRPATQTCEDPRSLEPDAAIVLPGDARGDAGARPLGELDGLRWLSPCMGLPSGTLCTCAPSMTSSVVHGAPGGRYSAAVRIRGLMEGGTYTGGTPMGAWTVGGSAATSFLNIYRLDVSSPPGHYFINTSADQANHLFDYMVDLKIDDGATVILTADGQDGVQEGNGGMLIVPGVANPPSPYDGQFAQLSLVSVTPL